MILEIIRNSCRYFFLSLIFTSLIVILLYFHVMRRSIHILPVIRSFYFLSELDPIKINGWTCIYLDRLILILNCRVHFSKSFKPTCNFSYFTTESLSFENNNEVLSLVLTGSSFIYAKIKIGIPKTGPFTTNFYFYSKM